MSESARGEVSESEVAMTSNFLREPNLGRQLLGGYSIEETDQLLRRAAATVDRLRKSLMTLRQEAASAAVAPAGEPSPLRLADDVLAAPGITPPGAASTQATFAVGELMTTAHEAIQLLREKAEHDARQVIEEAHGEASAIIAEAAKERARLEEEQAAAQQVIDSARRQAAGIVANAQREREQILADTDQLKSAAEQLRHSWINQFSQMIEQLSQPAASPPENGESPEIDRELIERLQNDAQSEAEQGQVPE